MPTDENGTYQFDNLAEGNINDFVGDIKEYFNVSEKILVDNISHRIIYVVVNQQIPGSVTIVKKTGGRDNLEGAKFSLYQVSSGLPENDNKFYTSNEGVRENLTNAYKSCTTAIQYKVILGTEEQLDSLENYDSSTNKITVDGKQYTVHKQQVDGEIQYYYYTPTETEGAEKVDVAVFHNLPLYLNGADVYYTIRKTKVPEGYLALADFTNLTRIDLKNGYSDTSGNYIRDICFEVENTRAMELPITSGSGMRNIVTIGTVMVLLGGFYLFFIFHRHRTAKGGLNDDIHSSLLKNPKSVVI